VDDDTKARILLMLPLLDERQRRLYLAAEVNALGHGGLRAVHKLTGVAESVIVQGQKELEKGLNPAYVSRIRAHRSDVRLPLAEKYKAELAELEKIVTEDIGSTSENVLLWLVKSLRDLETELYKRGFKVSHSLIRRLLKVMGYQFRQNKKLSRASSSYEYRNAQFAYINKKCATFMAHNQPIVLVQLREKTMLELFNDKNSSCAEVKDMFKFLDFPVFQLKALSLGDFSDTCAVSENVHFVNGVASDDDTGFSVESVLRWWQNFLVRKFTGASKLFLICDDVEAIRVRELWRLQLQEFANLSGLEVHVSYLPSGAFRWNKFVDTLFCYVGKQSVDESCVSVKVACHIVSNKIVSKDANAREVSDFGEVFSSISCDADVFCASTDCVIRPKNEA